MAKEVAENAENIVDSAERGTAVESAELHESAAEHAEFAVEEAAQIADSLIGSDEAASEVSTDSGDSADSAGQAADVVEPIVLDEAKLARAREIAKREVLCETRPDLVGEELEPQALDARTVVLRFVSLSPSYPGWHWSVTVSQVDADSEYTVTELALMPGDDSLIAPEWVPWTERMKQFRKERAERQAAERAAAEAERQALENAELDADTVDSEDADLSEVSDDIEDFAEFDDEDISISAGSGEDDDMDVFDLDDSDDSDDSESADDLLSELDFSAFDDAGDDDGDDGGDIVDDADEDDDDGYVHDEFIDADDADYDDIDTIKVDDK